MQHQMKPLHLTQNELPRQKLKENAKPKNKLAQPSLPNLV